ncbi:MAG TPA: hypothetical protein VK742_19795 [Candidatus Sulfotelmatobacter sp.]|jgi:hypothetical protein|nr:hypothetical protein [Candidatus Sulfotelmatobacter sp.]
MSIPDRIEQQTERRSHSIYSRLDPPSDSRVMHEIFNNLELPLSLKFSAVLAACAHFKFPLQFSAFRSLIPDSAWDEHFRFRWIGMRTGAWPIFCGNHEWEYELRMVSPSRYGQHIILIVTNSDIDRNAGHFEPPLDLSVVRFTLCHPFLQPELHDPSGIYLFGSV